MIWSTNLRFNLDKSPYREAHSYLKNMDRKTHKSINKVVAIAVCEHFKRLEKSANDPYLETREREDNFVNRIVESVKIAVEKAMPSFMAAYITAKLADIPNIAISSTASENSVLKEENFDTAADNIDFEFVGE
ncbi:MAG: adenylate cyclase [Oscillospiraceae bacterium]|nr:adenylate cyclase [Oscillospiraceae bacterium]